MKTYHVTGKANRDFVKIGHYTEQAWGRAQRNKYLKSFVTRFGWIAKNPLLGKTRDDIKAGYRSYQEGKHVVFYIIDCDAVHIIGVLHEDMDFGRHL